jgi:hypothetical protein
MRAVLLFISLLFAACANLERTSPVRQLVGDWRYADQVQSCQYSFKSDGSFTGWVKQRDKLVSKFTGRWSINDRTLHYLYLSDVLGIPAGATDQDQLLEIKKDDFVIRAANGERRRYLRVR